MFGGSNLTEKSSSGRLFIFSLGLAYFATVTLDVLVSLSARANPREFQIQSPLSPCLNLFSPFLLVD
jgi:hypothetical protein